MLFKSEDLIYVYRYVILVPTIDRSIIATVKVISIVNTCTCQAASTYYNNLKIHMKMKRLSSKIIGKQVSKYIHDILDRIGVYIILYWYIILYV